MNSEESGGNAFEESEIVYAEIEGLKLHALFYCPTDSGNTPRPFVIDIHGGAWVTGDRYSGRHYCRELARAGIPVLAIDFRHGPKHQHPCANEDIAAAVQFVRQNESSLNVSISHLGLTGSSSGGHLALLSGLRPTTEHAVNIFTKGAFTRGKIYPSVDFVIALWPVSNPLARFQYVTARGTEDPDIWVNFQPLRLAEGHLAYFGTQAAMHEASIQRLLSDEQNTQTPNIFIVQPELDQNVPVFMSQTLHGALLARGVNVQYKLYPGVAHAFAQAPGPQTEACISDMVAYINRLGVSS